jgi:DNA modification methylase
VTPHYQDPWLTIHVGDNRAVLPILPERSVHCVVTSPPYYSLRDYGVVGQIGLEATVDEYVAEMVGVFRMVRRVMRDDATLWLNLGDSFGNKQLLGVPWRVAFALQADGWYLRSDIIWSKPNPMPESVTDRPTKSHEYLFLISKSPVYHFDADAVREDASDNSHGGREPNQHKRWSQGLASERTTLGVAQGGRNIRSVWSIATQPYPGAHFATFPPKLVEPCILAGTSERGVCPDCGSPWRRVVERTPAEVKAPRSAYGHGAGRNDGGRSQLVGAGTSTTGWEPTCAHGGAPVPATVLDPFGGSGTTAMVAQHLSRRAVLIELNPDYIGQALRRNAAVPLGLEDVA